MKTGRARGTAASPVKAGVWITAAKYRGAAGPSLAARSSQRMIPSAQTYFERSARPRNQLLLLIGMRRTLSFALLDFGSAIVSTPFLNEADAFSSSTPSSGIRRSNRP
jgi:hypothetical protein